MWNALSGCVVYICCVDFASLDVVCDELNDCAWNFVCSSFLMSVCMFIVVSGQIPAGQIPSGQIPDAQIPPGKLPAGKIPPGHMPTKGIIGKYRKIKVHLLKKMYFYIYIHITSIL